MKNYAINPVDTNDIDEVEFICRKHLETPVLWNKNYVLSEEEMIETKTNFIEAGEKNILSGLTVKIDNKIIGFIWFEILLKNPEIAEIISLWIDPEFRKQGIATALKQELEIVAKDKGFKKIRTNVYSSNKSMLDLNLKLGYKIIRYDLEKEL